MYERSTQARLWTFTEKKLKELREETNRTAVEAIKAIKEEEKNLFKSPSSKLVHSEPQCCNAKEELMLCRFFEKKLSDLCAFLKVSNRVRATAVLLYKRFFLKCSVMDCHPYQISFTTLFMATKIEEERMTIEAFIEKTKTPTAKLEPAQVLTHEITVLEKLDFNISVFNPYLPLYGFYIDMMKFFTSQGQAMVKPLYEAYKESIDVVHQTLVTDLCFLYHPSQIALGAFYCGCREKDLDSSFESYLKGKYDETSFEEIMSIVSHIQTVLDESKTPSDNLLNQLKAKLTECRNPATNPNSEFYKYKQREQQKKEEETRKRKLMDSKSSFGDDLETIQGPPGKKRVAEDEDLVLSTRGTQMNLSPRYQR